MQHQSFIESFVNYCRDTPTPPMFAKWAAISAISGAMERRVWAMTRNTMLIPNFIILLVSPPGIGKTRVIVEVHEMWLKAGVFNVAPTTVTRAAMIDQLHSKKFLKHIKDSNGNPTGKLFEYHSILVCAPEFGVFCPKHDLEFLNTINDLYDCRKNFIERRRSIKEVIEIQRPHISIIGGTQPSYLAELLPDAAYGMGFTSRCIMVYQGTGPSVPIFSTAQDKSHEFERLAAELKAMGELFGQVSWTEQCQLDIQNWVNSGMEPKPEHPRLENYNTRRDLHVLKLCLIRAISQHRMEIKSEDFFWARDTLLEAETLMPDVFKGMIISPDNSVVADTLTFIKTLFAKEKRPISSARLVNFVAARVPSHRVIDIITTMVSRGLLEELPQPSGLRFYQPGNPHEEKNE